jgi:hypothetical protein
MGQKPRPPQTCAYLDRPNAATERQIALELVRDLSPDQNRLTQPIGKSSFHPRTKSRFNNFLAGPKPSHLRH